MLCTFFCILLIYCTFSAHNVVVHFRPNVIRWAVICRLSAIIAIKPHRCYVAHRTKKNFYAALREIEGILSVEKVQREDLEQVRAKLNSYLGIMKHYRTYNIKRNALEKPNKFFKYGCLVTHYHKYCVHPIIRQRK